MANECAFRTFIERKQVSIRFILDTLQPPLVDGATIDRADQVALQKHPQPQEFGYLSQREKNAWMYRFLLGVVDEYLSERPNDAVSLDMWCILKDV